MPLGPPSFRPVVCALPRPRASVLAVVLAVAAASPLASQAVDPRLDLAIRLYTGVEGRVDDARAAELLRSAAADEDPISVMWLARVHSTGRMGFAADPVRARVLAASVIDPIRSLAAEGEPEAVFLMGTAYAEGLGVEGDARTAARWYLRAAELGNVLAQHNLGNVYASGTGVPQSHSLAVVWWRRAADQGDAIPQLRLGMAYELGRGVGVDRAKAVQWYRDSAARGNAAASAALRRLGAR